MISNIHCQAYIVKHILSNIHCQAYIVKYTLTNIHCQTYIVKHTLSNIHCQTYILGHAWSNMHCQTLDPNLPKTKLIASTCFLQEFEHNIFSLHHGSMKQGWIFYKIIVNSSPMAFIDNKLSPRIMRDSRHWYFLSLSL